MTLRSSGCDQKHFGPFPPFRGSQVYRIMYINKLPSLQNVITNAALAIHFVQCNLTFPEQKRG